MNLLRRWEFILVVVAALFWNAPATRGAGVTIITHGLNGNADGWVTGMAKQIPNYGTFAGTNYTFYKFYFYLSNGSYYLTWSHIAGGLPFASPSGEIIIAFDWSQLADGSSFNTYQIAPVLEFALTNSNFISELNGHALCELPIHLIGHSRGGSLMCETSRLLGTNGVWVDHLTTLDPHPLNNDGFDLDFLSGNTAVDAPCRTYQNILFHDNYWENIGLFVYGEAVSGAYIRQLTNVSGGYENIGDVHYPHSNVHLWYHGTVDERNPANDTEAQITSTEFGSWYVYDEQNGNNAGFRWSLIGRGNRLSEDSPLGFATPMIRSGYNQNWDLGAGTSQNRTALPSNNGSWPNVVKFNITGTNVVTVGTPVLTKLFYQYGGLATSVMCQLYLDSDLNPFNSNSIPVLQFAAPNTSVNSVFYYSDLGIGTSNVPPGFYAVYAKITDGVHSRFLYTPEILQIRPVQAADVVYGPILTNGNFSVRFSGTPGYNYSIESTTNLASTNWQKVVNFAAPTNNATGLGIGVFEFQIPMNLPRRYFRTRYPSE